MIMYSQRTNECSKDKSTSLREVGTETRELISIVYVCVCDGRTQFNNSHDVGYLFIFFVIYIIVKYILYVLLYYSVYLSTYDTRTNTFSSRRRSTALKTVLYIGDDNKRRTTIKHKF